MSDLVQLFMVSWATVWLSPIYVLNRPDLFIKVVSAFIRFTSDITDDDIIIQPEQLIGGDDNTNSSIGDPEFCGPAWKNTRLQSPPRQMANKPYDKLSHLDYKLS